MGRIRLGFDIGSDRLKIAIRRGNEIKIKQVRLPVNMADDTGVIAMPHAFAKFLKQTRRELSLPKGKASLVLPSSQSICRFVTMPRMTVSQLEMNLPYEFSDFIRDSADQYYCDYAICEPDGSENGDDMPMMAAMASKRVLADYREIFAHAGFRLRTVLPQEMALIRLCENRGAGEKEFCFVDFGHQYTRVTAILRDRVQATRQIFLGGRNIDAAISKELGTDPYLSNTYKITDFQNILSLPSVTEICDQIAVEVLKVINFYQFTYRSNNLSGVYLAGGGSALQPLRRSIGNIMDIPLLEPSSLLPKAGKYAAASGIFAAGAAMGEI